MGTIIHMSCYSRVLRNRRARKGLPFVQFTTMVKAKLRFAKLSDGDSAQRPDVHCNIFHARTRLTDGDIITDIRA